jgi:hypothetical protein
MRPAVLIRRAAGVAVGLSGAFTLPGDLTVPPHVLAAEPAGHSRPGGGRGRRDHPGRAARAEMALAPPQAPRMMQRSGRSAAGPLAGRLLPSPRQAAGGRRA